MRKCFPDPFRVRVAFRQQQLQINQLSGRVGGCWTTRPHSSEPTDGHILFIWSGSLMSFN